MKIESHLEKFRRFDIILNRLDPVHDPELWIWTAMNGCTHLLNAALHQCGATKNMHVGQPPLAAVLSPALEDAFAALRVLEDLREPHVRGSEPIPPGDERRWGEAYRRCVAQPGAALSLPPTQ